MSEKQRYIVYVVIGLIILAAYLSTGSMRRGAGGGDEVHAGSDETVPIDDAMEPLMEEQGTEKTDDETVAVSELEPLTEEESGELAVYCTELAASEWGNDPFRARGSAPVQVVVPEETDDPLPPAPLVLTGISHGTDRAFAVINRRVVSIGETIEGYEVAGIRKDRVELRDVRGRSRILTIDD